MKPLVFLHPLSERLSALKESLEETAEAENIEIFEIESIDEMRELAPHLGQFLALCSNPKLCSRMLQQNTRVLKKEQSKVILLSPKQFPRKIVDRLNKLGLTDLLLDNVAAKTLQYKVKLQLRSIVVKKDEDDEILIKHEEEIKLKEEPSKVDQGNVDEEEDLYGRKPKKGLAEDADEKPKEYPGKASLLLEDIENPDNVISHAVDEEEEVNELQSKGKTIADLEKSAEEKKKNLPWHKAKEESKKSGSSVTEKIDNVWSSQSNKGPNLKEKEEAELEGESSTDKLEKERKGKINEKEAAIETHWEGEVLDYTKKEKDYGEEESFYEDNIKGHYEGETEGTDELNEDFETAESSFKEGDKENMVGVSNVEKKKDRLKGDTVKELIQQDNLQTKTDGTDEFEGEMQSTGENTKAKEASLLKADFEGRNKIDDELNASLEEERSHSDKASMDLNPKLNNWEEDDLSADSQTDKSEIDPLSADSKMEKLGENLSSDSKGTDDKSSELLQTRGTGLSKEEQEKKKEKENALLKKIQENRKKNAPKKIDGHMRSPSTKRKGEEDEYEKLESLTPLQSNKKEKDSSKTGEFASDQFENDTGDSNTEQKNNDDMFGDSTPDQALEDMAGESEVDNLGDDHMEGDTKPDELKGDTYDSFGKQAKLEVEDDEEEKRKKRLEELYELKKQKLAELAEKERKRKEALANEEDLYKKDRDWDEKTLDMENSKNHNEVEMASEVQYGSNGTENLEAIKYDKSNNYDEEILEKRQRHENEEIIIDPSELSEMERELLHSMKDWGEQTINYKKIKAGEDGITVSRKGSEAESEFTIKERSIEKEKKEYAGSILEGDLEEEENQEEEGEEIIHPDSKGLESIVQILNSYFTKDIMPSDILSKTCTLVNKERGFGITSFFYRAHKSREFNEILNGHETLSSGDKLAQWNNYKQEMISTWTSLKLPTWSDKTFQDDKIYFYYPYFEGVDHLGFAIVSFNNGMKAENSSRIEVALEAARAVYLSQRHKENGEAAIYYELKEALPEEVLPFTLGDKAQPEPSAEPQRRYMEATDNLILLEKRKALKEEEKKKAEKSKKQGGFVKNLWNRMFG